MPDPKPKRAAIVSTGKAALATAAPEIAVPLAVAGKAAEVAGKVLTGDIVVVRTLRNVGTKKNPVWRETEVHYNVAAVGLGVLAASLGAGVAVYAWEGVPTPFGNLAGLKDNYRRFVDARKAKSMPPPSTPPSNLLDSFLRLLPF